MARPTSAAASAGASLTPSPTIATRCRRARPARKPAPCGPCRRAAPRRAPRRCPADFARQRLGRTAVVAADQHHAHTLARAGAATAARHPAWHRRRRPAGPGHADPGCLAAWPRPARPRCGPARPSRLGLRCASVATPSSSAPALLPRRSADGRSTVPSMPRPGHGPHIRARTAPPAPLRRQHGPRQRVFAAGLQRAGQRQQRSRRRRQPAGGKADHRGWPSVSVPVLSKATTCTCAHQSPAPAASRTRMPRRAARPVPTISVAGVARPSAQGQAMTSTDTAWISGLAQSPAAGPSPAA
jgi:hypothetical protein